MSQSTWPAYEHAEFRKSRYSTNDQSCVEVALRPGVAALRDSKQTFQTSPIVTVPTSAFTALLTTLRA